MPHPLATIIPDSNRLDVAFARSFVGGMPGNLLHQAYQSGFIGAFTDHTDQPQWARRIARWDRDDFRKNTPGRKKRTSDVASTLSRGAGGSFPNFRYALELWNGEGDKPFTRYQQFGDCVDSSSTEHEECLMGYRAHNLQTYCEQFKYACTYGRYAERGYCGDGWNGSGIAAVALRTGAFFARVYDTLAKKYDFTDEMKTESTMARTWCRSGLPQDLKDYVHANHPYEDGAITEFDGSASDIINVFASGGVIHTGGTNTSGSSKPCAIGSVGGHEQSILGCDGSPECVKFFNDKGISAVKESDPICIFSQTWGPGWSGEISDSYWPVGTKENGQVVTQADINSLRTTSDERTVRAYIASFAGTWGWGEKPEGAWAFSASQVMRCFNGDMFVWLPRVKGFPCDVPPPAPPPTPIPPTPGPTPGPKPPIVEFKMPFDVKAGESIYLLKKPQL